MPAAPISPFKAPECTPQLPQYFRQYAHNPSNQQA